MNENTKLVTPQTIFLHFVEGDKFTSWGIFFKNGVISVIGGIEGAYQKWEKRGEVAVWVFRTI